MSKSIRAARKVAKTLEAIIIDRMHWDHRVTPYAYAFCVSAPGPPEVSLVNPIYFRTTPLATNRLSAWRNEPTPSRAKRADDPGSPKRPDTARSVGSPEEQPTTSATPTEDAGRKRSSHMWLKIKPSASRRGRRGSTAMLNSEASCGSRATCAGEQKYGTDANIQLKLCSCGSPPKRHATRNPAPLRTAACRTWSAAFLAKTSKMRSCHPPTPHAHTHVF